MSKSERGKKMKKQVVQYARVSTEEQNRMDSVSLDQQIDEMDTLGDRSDWQVVAKFIDCENYVATQSPKKGKIANPSGERADRPEFLKMLEFVKSGEIDAIVCWRDDRLVRHPRVAVALEDALDIGDTRRPGRPKIEIYDATGVMIDRSTLSIKAAIWREENKRRAERVRMGRIGTLKDGRWPGRYTRLGYKAIAEEGKRGLKIVLADDQEVQTVRRIYGLCDSGHSIRDIREILIAESAQQKYGAQKWEWHDAVISQILRARDYTGEATWRFGEGTEFAIKIPRIIEPKLWKRCRDRIESNTSRSTRNAKGIYLLQGIARCGECDAAISVHRERRRAKQMADGSWKAYTHSHRYFCSQAHHYRSELHARPHSWGGRKLDWVVWRYLIDSAVEQPDMIRGQIPARQAKLQAQDDSLDGDIAHAHARLTEIDRERAFYQRQAARYKMTETEFDARMDETQEAKEYWQSEVERLRGLRDDAQTVQAGLDYVTELLETLRKDLASVDQTPRELGALPEERRCKVLRTRQKIIRTLCEQVRVYANGRVEIDGMVDGSEAVQFGSTTICSR
jgi:DNA invertase Pin-like site-specific DNA recombinase